MHLNLYSKNFRITRRHIVHKGLALIKKEITTSKMLKKKNTLAFTLIVGLTIILGGSSALFTNPVLDTTSADPYIHLHTDGFYYFVLSTEGGIVVMKNDILTNWRNPLDRQKVYAISCVKHCLNFNQISFFHSSRYQIPDGNANLWAPEIHNIDGQWYIYFTMGTGPIPTQRMWVIQALNPSNPLGAYTQAKR